MVRRVATIIQKEFKVDLRQRHAIAGILLLSIVLVFLTYKVFNNVTGLEWVLILWLLTTFAGLNAIVKSFIQEGKATYLYYYTLHNPIELILAKYLYNFVLLACLFGLITGCLMIFVGNPIKDYSLFFMSGALGTLGLSAIFTFISSIANVGGNNSTLLSILALPCALPILLTVIQISAVSLRLIQKSSIDQDILILIGIDGLVLGLGIILFPLVWRS